MAPEENAISPRKQTIKQTKKPQSLFERLSENIWKYRKLDQAVNTSTKISIVSLWSRSHSPVDNCSLFIQRKEYKSQGTSYKYRECSHSLQQSRRQYSFLFRSAKLAGGVKQALHEFLNGDRGNSFPFVTAPKIQIHSNFDRCAAKFFLFSLSASFF